MQNLARIVLTFSVQSQLVAVAKRVSRPLTLTKRYIDDLEAINPMP